MGDLVASRAGTVEQVPADLAGKLEWLCRFGKPRISRHDGWHAAIEMNTNTTGSQFKVSSGFDHGTVDSSVDELITRMLAALATIAGGRASG